jgi:hypothetical protein
MLDDSQGYGAAAARLHMAAEGLRDYYGALQLLMSQGCVTVMVRMG